MYSVTQERMRELLSATQIDGIKVGELMCAYLERYRQINKITSYSGLEFLLNSHFVPNMDMDKPVTDLSCNDFDLLKQKIADSNIENKNNVIAYVGRIFRFCDAFYGYHCLPAFRMSKIRKIYDASLIHSEYFIYDYKTFKIFISSVVDPFDEALFYSLYYLGLRIGEIRGLKWCDISKDGLLSINRSVSSKCGVGSSLEIDCKSKASYRYFKLPNFIKNSFEELHVSNPDSTYIFEEKKPRVNTGMAVSESSIRRRIKAQAELSGLPYLHPHGWRHSCASYLVNELKCNIFQVKEWMGHSSIDVTSKIYVHLFPEIKDAISNNIQNEYDRIYDRHSSKKAKRTKKNKHSKKITTKTDLYIPS